MNIISFLSPFQGEIGPGFKKRSLGHFAKSAGVYLIKENGVIVYVGMSASNVTEACYRHFYYWKESYADGRRQYRVSYFDRLEANHYEICILETNKEQAHELEKAMIISMNPRDNREKYEAFKGQIENIEIEQESEMPW